jgi:hypothetical protein
MAREEYQLEVSIQPSRIDESEKMLVFKRIYDPNYVVGNTERLNDEELALLHKTIGDYLAKIGAIKRVKIYRTTRYNRFGGKLCQRIRSRPGATVDYPGDRLTLEVADIDETAFKVIRDTAQEGSK